MAVCALCLVLTVPWFDLPSVIVVVPSKFLVKNADKKNYFSYFSTKTYVVGTQRYRLDETVLFDTQNICLN